MTTHNTNKGQRTAVQPIRNLTDVASIKKMLSGNKRNYLLFVMGINNGLRTGDLLQIKVEQVKDIKIGETVSIVESKTGKENVLMINKAVYKALKSYLAVSDLSDSGYLFQSRKVNASGEKQLTVTQANRMIKSWTKAINMKGNYGAHSLRKTWGYHQRVTFGTGIEIITKRFNHSTPAITMRYLGIQDKEVNGALLNEL